jgi:hypothetical protein
MRGRSGEHGGSPAATLLRHDGSSRLVTQHAIAQAAQKVDTCSGKENTDGDDQ